MATTDLQGVSRTLLIPLACRASESARPDALLHDPRAAELLRAIAGGKDSLMGMGKMDQTFTILRACQFDRTARAFLDRYPAALVVDIGCGLDTRFDRLDDGRMTWLGLDLPEVVELRRSLLPDSERCQTLAKSMLDLSWLEAVARIGRPAIFLAEGVFVYFNETQVRSVVTALAGRFPGGELVFDALSTLVLKMHKRHPVLKKTGAHVDWSVDDPLELESWGLRLLDRWGYFDQYEPRLGLANWMRYTPIVARSNFVLHYRLGI
ncbi:MAG: class I SAM-dependent methyltransferase [Chloroflexi bacterium]|nr:class I SAM-dependent methyltransferase [Chloroflexota bacterium]